MSGAVLLAFRVSALAIGAVLAGGLSLEFAQALGADSGLSLTDIVLTLLFLSCCFWISFSFVLSVAGFIALVLRGRPPGPADPGNRPLSGRTAVVMTIYNEDPANSVANVAATANSVRAAGAFDKFDFFLLSDTTRPDVMRDEVALWQAACADHGLAGKLFYRHRDENVAAKAGNVADFCKRWGGAYDYMVVLDADSLMEGDTLVRLARLMDAHPRAGLIQTQTKCVGRSTLFARLMQFSGALYGPVFAAGQALWQGRDGNYWGHNAIIRTRAFASCCGLPRLRGRPPLGGHILSHDFVEAALLRRAGWEVWLVPELGGSYEECPPTFLDYVKRDQRWCQGNMQHFRLLATAGLHPVSRFHLVTGIMSFLCAPLWMAFLLLGLGQALGDAILGHDYFRPERALFPAWPVFDAAHAAALFLTALGLLLAPRLLAVVLAMARPESRRGFGGPLALVGSTLLELVHSALMAPLLMVFHSCFIASTLLGRSIRWDSQVRTDRATPWRTIATVFGPMMFAGAAVGAAAWYASAALFLWLLPVIVGLVAAPILCRWSSLVSAGAAARRVRLFLTAAEVDPPALIAEARRLSAELAAHKPTPDMTDALVSLARRAA